MLHSSVALAELAVAGHGVALLPAVMFARHLREGSLARPFAAEVEAGRYWLTWPRGRPHNPAMEKLRA
ncbi:LysR substrate-binding domain-containing protein [Paracoccus sp. PAMC 22219]|uniref:LysR substrate-binding domain-containing protein n=1 Tax=Paracoccus sp. PAMC 22219 TaxID=1569209 RepID=UPI000AFA90B2|nr:LysR substrate-binding domain-containing protein [Paracoccus sp. PAMC 22219]